MMEYLETAGAIVFMVFFFGFCIFIHELGHFLAAKWRGLHITAFSIGFRKIWGVKRGGVEYRIGWLPFGGYVELPQIDSGSDKPALDEEGKVISPAKPLDKIITAFAGPLFNIIFGFVLGIAIWIHGLPMDTPRMKEVIVDDLKVESPEYAAGLRDGDIIYKVNGEPFNTTWHEIVQKILFTVGNVTLDVRRNSERLKVSYIPKENPDVLPGEGIAYPFFRAKVPVIVYPYKSSPAYAAGLREGDEVLSVDGQEIFDAYDLNYRITNSSGKSLDLTVRRDGKIIEIKKLTPVTDNSSDIYRIGVADPEPVNGHVRVRVIINGSPAQRAGLLPGDIIVSAAAKQIKSFSDLQSAVNESAGKPVSLKIIRGQTELDLSIVPVLYKFYSAGIFYVYTEYPNPWEQFTNVIALTYKSLKGVFYGLGSKVGLTDKQSTLKPKHFSGPIGIGHIIYVAVAKASIWRGFYYIVIITFSLGILNLMPMPVLDGGHIVLGGFEMLTGRPVPHKIIQPVAVVFVSLLVAFMVFVTFHDIRRMVVPSFSSKASDNHEAASSGKDKKDAAIPATPEKGTSDESLKAPVPAN